MVYRISAIVHLYCDTAVTITSLMIVVYTYNLVFLLFVFIRGTLTASDDNNSVGRYVPVLVLRMLLPVPVLADDAFLD